MKCHALKNGKYAMIFLMLTLIFSIISELSKEFPAILLVERFLIFNNSPKAR